MPSLLEKIAASAAERLTLPAGRKPSEELARYKGFLKVETHRLKILHRAGAGGLEICHARAAVLDELVRHIFSAIRQNAAGTLDARRSPIAVIALGGYGRGELNPHSDIDLMLLHDGELVSGGRPRPYLSALADGLFLTLWDVGQKVGHSVRSVEDCVRVANADMQSKTSLLEARFVAGDQALFKRMQSVVLAKCIHRFEDAYVAMRLTDQNERRTKYGNSACMQEPNLKNGCGGLRDYQNLMWMAFFKYRIHSMAELESREQINASERKQLETAYDFILRTRNELHYHADRAADVLTKSAQAAVAYSLGYTARSPSERIEEFMRDLYTHLRNVYLITRNVEQRLALVPHKRRLPSIKDILLPRRLAAKPQVIDGFEIIDGVIHADSPRVFRDSPRRLMKVFLIAQQRGLQLHPDLAGMARNQVSLVDSSFVRDEHVRETFLEILSQRGNVAPALRAMHEVGLLGKYIPEFGKLTCLVQHEFYHQYAADEHTLMCLEKLDRIWGAQTEPGRQYAELFQKVERPWLLYLCLLLHDTGKAEHTGKHAVTGAHIATQVARRLKLDGTAAHTLRLVIEHHLVMVQISQRRDLDDPAVIQQFALTVQNRENLDLLTLHTYADSLGTADNLWNGFKDSLLWSLHHRTEEFLGGGTQFIRAEARQRELLLEDVRQHLPATIGDDELEAHFAALPPRYFQIHTPELIAADLRRTHRFMHLQLSLAVEDHALAPVITWQDEPDRGYSVVNICTWDRAGLFSKITGSLTAAGLNILNAQIFSRADGVVLDAFFVTDAQTGLPAPKPKREKFERTLHDVLTGAFDLAEHLSRHDPGRPLYQSLDREPIPTRIHFDNQTSETRTVIDLETEDRVGLLFAISVTLADLGVDISLAKISTEKGAAFDSFYVTDIDGGRILAPERQHFVEGRLRTAIAKLDE